MIYGEDKSNYLPIAGDFLKVVPCFSKGNTEKSLIIHQFVLQS